MQQLSNLAGWPPQGGAGPFDTRKETFTKSPESVTFRKVDRIVGTRVDMTCLFGKEVVTFKFFAPNKGIAENVAAVLGQSGGQTLLDLGMLYLPDSE
jgi:hypothetical protein